jgi:hypothetical protein
LGRGYSVPSKHRRLLFQSQGLGKRKTYLRDRLDYGSLTDNAIYYVKKKYEETYR